MKLVFACGLISIAAMAIVVWRGAPTMARQDQAAALNARAEELYRAAKFADGVVTAQQALAIRERVLGPNHLEVAQSLTSLADLYREQGRYAEAEPLFRRALTIR